MQTNNYYNAMKTVAVGILINLSSDLIKWWFQRWAKNIKQDETLS